MKTPEKSAHACPQCGQPVSRVHRHFGDRVVAVLEKVYRYRCTNPECEWEGIVSLPTPQDAAAGAHAVTWKIRATWLLIGAAMALVAVGGIKLYRSSRSPAPSVAAANAPAPLPVPAGESFDGYALPSDDVRVKGNRTDLTIRRGCAWGVPGGNPYKGTVRQALVAARLPEDVTSKIGILIERGIVSDRVVITRDSINTTSGKRRFDTTIPSMAFGKTVCFGTRVNFQPGHVEVADIYDATDATGAKVTVMVPYVCGNVSVLSERPHYYLHNGDHSVPEPAAAASLVAALTALFLVTRVRRQRD